jgi:DNA polymerase-3 subunit gamma/tau
LPHPPCNLPDDSLDLKSRLMSDSQVIARRFRPQLFDQVIGQEAITRTLTNAIQSGRIHHAYLFAGARGVGKTTTARILAKALNCVHGPTVKPCGQCDSCVEIARSSSIDVLEIDAASNTGVENVREAIINTISISAARGRYRIFIIDEVHQLSAAAFNALLKTLEEPPPHIVFILATTELHKVPETIVSRCQVFEFRTISAEKIFEQLKKIVGQLGVSVSDSALAAIARAGEGSMRDAESALDQVISFAGTNITDEDVSAALGLVSMETLNSTIRAIAEQDSLAILRIVEEVVTRGYDLRNFCRELMSHIRALLVIRVAGFDRELLSLYTSDTEELARLADAFSEQDLIRFFTMLTKIEQDIKVSSQPRFQLEIGLIRLAHARRLHLIEDAIKQLAEIQSRLTGCHTHSTSENQHSVPRPNHSLTQQPADSTKTSPAVAGYGAHEAVPKDLMPQPAEKDLDQHFETRQAPPVGSISDSDAVERIKSVLEARRKMLLLTALDKADSIEVGDTTLKVSYSPAAKVHKNQIESRDNRRLIEEACLQALGRRLTLSVTISAPGPVEAQSGKAEANRKEKRAEDHPAVRTLVDRFRGEVVEVIGPDGGK